MTPDRPVMLAILANWPIPARQAWGEKANALEESGAVPFPDSERRAFAEVKARLDAGEFREKAEEPKSARRTGRDDGPNMFG